MHTRRCNKCLHVKSLDDFYNCKTLPLGKQYVCKICQKEQQKLRRSTKEGREKANAATKKWHQSERGHEYAREYVRVQKERYPEKIRARKIVYLAIRRGKLQRQPCVVCGTPNAEAHHRDYSRPYDITWLCTEHHRELHRENLKSFFLEINGENN